jgi:hypothetical protein
VGNDDWEEWFLAASWALVVVLAFSGMGVVGFLLGGGCGQ